MFTCQECGLPIAPSEQPVEVRPVAPTGARSGGRAAATGERDAQVVHERCVHDAARRGFRPLE